MLYYTRFNSYRVEELKDGKVKVHLPENKAAVVNKDQVAKLVRGYEMSKRG